MKYTAFGEIRDINGSSPTDYESKRCFDFKAKASSSFRSYTGQRKEVEFGLSYYVARWYDPQIAHFVQADTIIPQPGVSGAWDRYAYVLNNPLKYIDPSGHVLDTPNDNYPLLDGKYTPDEYLLKTIRADLPDMNISCKIGETASIYSNTFSKTYGFYISNPVLADFGESDVSDPNWILPKGINNWATPPYVNYRAGPKSKTAGVMEAAAFLAKYLIHRKTVTNLKNSSADLFVTLVTSVYTDKRTIDSFTITNNSNQSVTGYEYGIFGIGETELIDEVLEFVNISPGESITRQLNYSFPNYSQPFTFEMKINHNPTFMYEMTYSYAKFSFCRLCP